METGVTLDTVCVRSEDVVACEVEGKIVIVPLVAGVGDASSEICTLSETGWVIWQKLDGERSLDQVAEALVEWFSSPIDEIRGDVLGFVSEMMRRGACLKLSGERIKELGSRGYVGDKSVSNLTAESDVMNQLPQEKPSAYVARGGELRLSNPGQLELLLGMKERGVPLRTTVRGFSMYPFIKDKDVLTIAPLGDRQLRLGEVVAFRQTETGRLAIHRILKKTGTGWLVRGDNCPVSDGVVSPEKIIGRVIRIERGSHQIRLSLGPERIVIAFLNRGDGLVLLRKFWQVPRRIVGFALSSLQKLALYRLLGRCFAPSFGILRASDSDLKEVHLRFNPSIPYCKQQANPNVTNLVAKHGGKLTGFVQLVYHPEDHNPWKGFWLFSLHVWGRYRALGLGEKLTRCIVDEAKSLGAADLLLAVYEDNCKAIDLYRKLGFSHVTMLSLEPLLAAEKEKAGRRRVIMIKEIEVNQ